jgi:dihydroflavonol-4-reductase
MRVLVTGATGLVGSAVARELAGRGHEVRVLARPTSDTSVLADVPFEIAMGDVLDAASVRSAVEGCDAVVHTAGVVSFRATEAARLMDVNGHGVEIVLGAAHAAGVRRAVLTSSTSVMGGTHAPVVKDESSPGNAEALGIPYFVSKLRGEEAARALFARGLPVVLVRPAYVLGPGDVHGTSSATLVAIVKRRIPAYVEGGVSFCDVRDVARGHAEALERGRPGETYVLGGHNLTTGEMIHRVASMAGVRPPRRIAYPLALAFATAQEAWASVTGGRAAMTRDLVRSAALYTYVSSGKAERELGYTVRSFEDMVADTLRWFIAHGKLRAATLQLRALAGSEAA